MPTDKIKPYGDPRISLRSALVNGYTYGYLYSTPPPSVPKRGSIVLIHGWPDLSMGWRYQIPYLTSLGLEVIAIDCLGYGRSDSPPSSRLSAYTFKRIADDIAELCRQLHISSVILGGHDWGGAIVYRVQQYHPNLIRAFFAICTPYGAPQPTFTPLQLVVDKTMPNFRYQLHLVSGEVEAAIQSRQEIEQLLHALYGGRTPEGEVGFIPEVGVLLSKLPHIQNCRLLSADEMNYYVSEFARHGMNGPLNWYRTRELNYLDDLRLFYGGGEKMPKKGDPPVAVTGCEVLFLQADKDLALKPFMAAKMDERIERLTWKHVDSGHWCLWLVPDECNRIIGEWLEEKVFSDAQHVKEGPVKSKL